MYAVAGVPAAGRATCSRLASGGSNSDSVTPLALLSLPLSDVGPGDSSESSWVSDSGARSLSPDPEPWATGNSGGSSASVPLSSASDSLRTLCGPSTHTHEAAVSTADTPNRSR